MVGSESKRGWKRGGTKGWEGWIDERLDLYGHIDQANLVKSGHVERGVRNVPVQPRKVEDEPELHRVPFGDW